MANKKILPGGRYIHPVRSHLSMIRANPLAYSWTGENATNPYVRIAAAQNTGKVLNKLDSNEARRFVVDRSRWLRWAAEDRLSPEPYPDDVRLPFDSLWVEFNDGWPAFGEEPEVRVGQQSEGMELVGFYVEDYEQNSASVTMFQMGTDEQGKPMVMDTSFVIEKEHRVAMLAKATIEGANEMWPTDQSELTYWDADEFQHEDAHRAGGIHMVSARPWEDEGAGWYERMVRLSGSIVISLLDYMTRQSTVFVNLDPAPSRQQRRANERLVAAGGHVPRPFHLVEVRPSYIEPEEPEEEGRRLAYQTDVRGHHRKGSLRRVKWSVGHRGLVKLSRKVPVKPSWVHPHLKGPKDAPYIPSTYVVED